MTTPDPTTLSWAMPYGQLQWLRQASPSVARKFFNTPNSFVVGGSAIPGLSATVLPLFTSLHDYHAAGGTMTGAQFQWVCYDPENWSKTLEIEKRHIELAFWCFCDLAHCRGQKVVLAPSRDIIYAKGSCTPWQWPETINDGYVRIGVPLYAQYADTFICQAQGSEKVTTDYASLIYRSDKQTAASQTFWAELTTNFATAQQMKDAYDAAMASGAVVSGYWVSIMTQDQAPIAADFFNML